MRKPRSSWWAGVAIAWLSLLPPDPTFAANAPRPPARQTGPATIGAALDPDSLLLLSVTLDGLNLTDGLGAYGDAADPLVPVGELARLLEADIDVEPASGRITGRLGQARRPLTIDLAAGIARAGGESTPLTAADYSITPTEIYLRVGLLGRLLGIKVETAADELTLRLRPSEKFPVQARLDRMANRNSGASFGSSDVDTLKAYDPYRFIRPPGVDVVLDTGLQSGRQTRMGRYDFRFAGDLAWSNVQGFLGSDEQGRATNARLMLQRRSIEGSMLGPLKAREISAGDIFTPALAMGARSISGRGITVSTAPLDQTNIFNRIDLRGELPPGYDVELYINDILRASTNQAVNGRYEFLAVPLSPGINIVRVVTYGPRGERTEDVQVVNVGAALLRPGEARLAFGIAEQNQPLFEPRAGGRPVVGDSNIFAQGGTRIVASMDYGVSDLLSLTAGVARAPRVNGGAAGIYALGARTSFFGLATQADAAWDSRGGTGASIGLAGQYLGVSGILRHAEYRDGFIDENNLAFNTRLEMRRRTELTLDHSLNLRGRIVPISMRALRNGYSDGSSDFAAGVRGSSSLGAVLISTGLEYQRQDLRGARSIEALNGYVTASTFRSFLWQVRTSFDYEVLPDFKPRFLTVTVDRRLSDLWSLRFGLGQPLDHLDNWNILASGILTTSRGDLALTGEYDNARDDWRIAAQWSFGLGWNPAQAGYHLTRTGPGSGASMLFDAFSDDNGDGVRQPNEAAVPGVRIQGAAGRNAMTGPDGRLYATGLGAGPISHLDVDLDALDEGAVVTPPTRLELRPRPGSVVTVPYPVQPTGGVVVKVELVRDDGRKVGLASVRLQLVHEGRKAVEAVTEFDGTAVFDATPIGEYRLQIDPAQAAKLRMRLLSQPSITISKGDYAPDVAVQVRFEPPPVAGDR